MEISKIDEIRKMINTGKHIYEIHFEGAKTWQNSMLIIGKHMPSFEETDRFISRIEHPDYMNVDGIHKWSPEDYDSFVDFVDDLDDSFYLDDIEKWPVFGENTP